MASYTHMTMCLKMHVLLLSTLNLVYTALLSLTPDGLPLWEYFFSVRTGLGWVGGTAGLTGVCLVVILSIMVVCSLPCVRRKGYFQASIMWS